MIFDFPTILTMILAAMLLLIAADKFYLSARREGEATRPWLIAQAYDFFWVIFIVWIIRSFFGQGYAVPSGSLEPTVKPVEFIVVNQFKYGIRLPVIHKKIFNISEPKRGDIVVFRWPPDEHWNYVKRLIGVPGDRISYHNKVLTINGKIAKQTKLSDSYTIDPKHLPVETHQEALGSVKHDIYLSKDWHSNDDFSVVVPPGYYFMMGDNRDFSGDSRSWGFVPEKNIIGQAFMIALSFDTTHYKIRWSRLGKRI